MTVTRRIIEHKCIINDSTLHTIYDVYEGSDPRDYMMPDFKPARKVASFGHRAAAQAYLESVETKPSTDIIA